jgi:hypothetical protein
MLEDGMTGNANLSARNKRIEQKLSPIAEEGSEVQLLLIR